MNRDKPLMLTQEPWSDLESRRSRTIAHQNSERTGTVEHGQKQRHLGVMAQLREQSPVSKRPFFWAQGGSRDMFTQAVARNVVAISKEKQSPHTKQGAGPVLTPNAETGLKMIAHRDKVIQHYHGVVAHSARDRDQYSGFLNQSEENLRQHDENRRTAHVSQHKEMDEDRTFQVDQIAGLRSKVEEYSLSHDLHVDRLGAAQQTHVSWPGHEDWGAVTKSMKGSSSKLLTLGHGNRNLDYVSEEIAPTRQDQLHKFGDVVESQVASGLPLDNVAKRLDACHGSANPMSQEWITGLQDVERRGKLTPVDRTDFLKTGSSTQKLAQAYQDRGVPKPSVKGVDTTMARFPNKRPNPTYINEVKTDEQDGRAPRSAHSVTHAPIFRMPPPLE